MGYSKFIFKRSKLLKNLGQFSAPKICAMVKANAYGVGLEKVCKTLYGKVAFFGVANLDEALAIRALDNMTKILIVGITENYEIAIKNNISLCIENLEQILFLEQLINKNKINKKIFIHLKINSGMNRFGEKKLKLIKKIIKKLKNNNIFIFEGIFTHFSTIENDELFFNKQLIFFNKIIKLIPPIFNPIIHFGGGAVDKKIDWKLYPNSMLRVGFNLYKNVVKIESKIIKIFDLNFGERLGYSNGYIATKKVLVAIIPLGYADGINRKLSNVGFVKIKNKKCKIIGNICMDALFVDVSELSCSIYEKVVVFDEPFTPARLCGTIPYEILTDLNYSRMEYIVE